MTSTPGHGGFEALTTCLNADPMDHRCQLVSDALPPAPADDHLTSASTTITARGTLVPVGDEKCPGAGIHRAVIRRPDMT